MPGLMQLCVAGPWASHSPRAAHTVLPARHTPACAVHASQGCQQMPAASQGAAHLPPKHQTTFSKNSSPAWADGDILSHVLLLVSTAPHRTSVPQGHLPPHTVECSRMRWGPPGIALIRASAGSRGHPAQPAWHELTALTAPIRQQTGGGSHSQGSRSALRSTGRQAGWAKGHHHCHAGQHCCARLGRGIYFPSRFSSAQHSPALLRTHTCARIPARHHPQHSVRAFRAAPGISPARSGPSPALLRSPPRDARWLRAAVAQSPRNRGGVRTARPGPHLPAPGLPLPSRSQGRAVRPRASASGPAAKLRSSAAGYETPKIFTEGRRKIIVKKNYSPTPQEKQTKKKKKEKKPKNPQK